MRYLTALSLVLILSTSPVKAKDLGRSFGKAYCRTPVVCPSHVNSKSFNTYITGIVARANQCLNSYFSANQEGGFFEQSYPDGEGCLEQVEVQRTGGTPFLRPRCCLVEDTNKEGSCKIICTLNEVR